MEAWRERVARGAGDGEDPLSVAQRSDGDGMGWAAVDEAWEPEPEPARARVGPRSRPRSRPLLFLPSTAQRQCQCPQATTARPRCPVRSRAPAKAEAPVTKALFWVCAAAAQTCRWKAQEAVGRVLQSCACPRRINCSPPAHNLCSNGVESAATTSNYSLCGIASSPNYATIFFSGSPHTCGSGCAPAARCVALRFAVSAVPWVWPARRVRSPLRRVVCLHVCGAALSLRPIATPEAMDCGQDP